MDPAGKIGPILKLLDEYYDPLYRYPDKPSGDYELNLDSGDMDRTVAAVKELLSQ